MAEEKLLAEVKNYLDITWEDDAGDLKLASIIARGKEFLNGIAGEMLDYVTEEMQKALLCDYVRYVRSNALDEFQKNYKKELLSLQISREVRQYDPEKSTNVQ